MSERLNEWVRDQVAECISWIICSRAYGGRHNHYTDYNDDIEEERKGITWNKTLRNKEGMINRKLKK